MDKGQDGRSRLERDVDEILERTAAPIPITAKARSTSRSMRQQLSGYRRRIRILDSFWGWILIAVAVYILGGRLTDQTGLVWQLVRIVGLGAMLMALYRILRPQVRHMNTMWRGKQLNMGKPGVELGDRFDEWRKRR